MAICSQKSEKSGLFSRGTAFGEGFVAVFTCFFRFVLQSTFHVRTSDLICFAPLDFSRLCLNYTAFSIHLGAEGRVSTKYLSDS